MGQISESDWILLQGLCGSALERFCQHALREIERLLSDPRESSHQRYLRIVDLVQQQDDELARIFNGLRRTTAVLRLAAFQARGLLSENELQQFSPETRDAMGSLQIAGRG